MRWILFFVLSFSVFAIDTSNLAKLPVLEGGRLKPFDSLARQSLMALSHKQALPGMSASEWLALTCLYPAKAVDVPCFRIDHPDLLHLIKPKAKLATMRELVDHYETICQHADSVSSDAYAKAACRLAEQIQLYTGLLHSVFLPDSPDPYAEWLSYQQEFKRTAEALRAGQEPDVTDMIAYVDRYEYLDRQAHFRFLPAEQPESMGRGLLNHNPHAESTLQLVDSFRAGNQAAFDAALLCLLPPDNTKIQAEVLFNRIQPFAWAIGLYVCSVLGILLYWLFGTSWLKTAGLASLSIGFVIHTVALCTRVYLEGRPPVTSLYTSALFIGWGCCGLGLLLERRYREQIAALAAATIGLCTLIVAHNLAEGADTLAVMRAVLDSNFWLATHVICITLGYSASFFAGFLALVFAIRKPSQQAAGMLYATIAFSLLLSFVGTMLGGIWADQAWGRFWGWDPKENGALMIVLFNAICLHARFGGFIATRGLAVLAVLGNIVTAWSWFGVNMLGVGLHSYGFMDEAFVALAAFMASQLLLAPVVFYRMRQSVAQQS